MYRGYSAPSHASEGKSSKLPLALLQTLKILQKPSEVSKPHRRRGQDLQPPR